MSKKILTILLSILMLLTTMNFSGFVIAEDEKSTVLTNESVSVEGILPDGTELNANYVTFGFNPAKGSIKKAASRGTDEHLYDLFIDNNTLVTIDSVIAAYDIKLVNNGENVQPNGKVKVTIDDVVLNEGNDVRVVHVFDNATAIISAIKEGRAIKVTNPAYVNQFTKEARIAYEATGLENVVYVEVFKSEDGQVEVGKQSVSFETDSFSIFLIGEQNEKVLTVNYHGVNDSVTTVYVKLSDKAKSDEDFNAIVYDPGIGGSLGNGLLFRGWSIDNADYTTTTESKTIEGVRQYIKDLEWNDGDVLDLYAMIFKTFTVTYLDENEVALSSGSVLVLGDEESYPYTVNQPYTPPKQDQNFEGWMVNEEGEDSGIIGHTAGTIYPNHTNININGNVIFRVNAPSGQWLVFNENMKGATYNAPEFVKQGELSHEPKLEMKCTGYTFAGWYTGAPAQEGGDPTGELYTFNQPVSQRTVLYAKWTPNPTAKYTVIVWKQSVVDAYDAADEDKTYDFAFSTQIETNSLVDVSSLDLSAYQNKDGQTISVDGNNYSFYGFKYNIVKGVVSNNTKVQPNNTTVINLYYDREIVTYSFNTLQMQVVNPKPTGSAMNNGEYYIFYNNSYTVIRYRRTNWGTNQYYLYGPTQSNNGTQYAYINGNWTELEYAQASGSYNYYWWYQDSSGWHVYDGQRYAQISNNFTSLNQYTVYSNQWNSREVMTGLYGQKLQKYNYTWPTDYRWFNSIGGNTFTSIMDMFGSSVNDNPTDEFHSDFYGYSFSANTNVYHYLQNVDGSWPNTPTYTIPTIVGNGMVFRNFQGFETEEFRIKLPTGVYSYQTGSSYNGDNLVNPVSHTTTDGWTEWMPYGTGVEYEGNSRHETTRWNATEGGIEFRYSRNTFKLTYMVGQFVNANNEIQLSPISGTLKTVSDISYEASFAEYASYVPEEQEGFVFGGWYIDETCTTPFDFSTATMPMNGVIVYAKWTEIQYRVFLHPNAGGQDSDHPRDTTLEWGTGNRQMNFRVSYNAQVSSPTGIRKEYEMIGWYMDPEFTESFNMETRLTDSLTRADGSSAYSDYNKDTDYTDDMDKWGIIYQNPTNGDTSRYWITKKLDLYLKWRSILVGANGIGVIYDLNGGVGTVEDTRQYLDEATAIAQQAPRTAPAGQRFKYWVLQQYNANTGEYEDTELTYYPGADYTVLKSMAKDEELAELMPDNITHKHVYTIQLRAEYGPIEEPQTTKIIYNANGGSLKSDSPAQINLLVDEPTYLYTSSNLNERTGYTFVGWAFTSDATSAIWNGGEKAGADNFTRDDYEGNGSENTLYAVWKLNIEYVVVTPLADHENHKYEETVTLNVDEQKAIDSDLSSVISVKETLMAKADNAGATVTNSYSDVYEFIGWFTNEEGTGTAVSTNLSLIPEKDSNGDWKPQTYYAVFVEKEVTINYVALPVNGETAGTVDPTAETIGIVSGTASGSEATVDSSKYRFIGWFSDERCTQMVSDKDHPHYIPEKAEGSDKWVDGITYYAKFDYNFADLIITKKINARMSQFYRPDGDEESFEFTVIGTGENTANVRLKVVINVNVDNIDVPITIKNLPVGEYTITEVSQTNGWNWRYSPVGETTKSFVLMPSDDDSDRTVRFEDTLTETKWLSGTHYAHFPIAVGNTEGGGN